MNCKKWLIACALTWAMCQWSSPAYSLNLSYTGSQANIGGTFYPGGGLPYVTVPWRSTSANNIYAVSSEVPNQYYGTAGYALFATTFTYPNANLLSGEPNIDPIEGDPLFPNVIDLPDWVADSQVLSTRMAGGYGYSLIDDPVLQHGYRLWTFDGVNYPPANPTNVTGQNPWVKMGFLDGNDILGNNPSVTPTGRWGFTVGADVPQAFRVGVMTGGMDSANFAPDEVFIQQFDGLTPVGDPLGTGTLTGPLKDRFVDMHFFDIVGASEGDSFVLAVTAGANSFGNAGVAGFSFDVLPAADADFDASGAVDGKDYLIWQQGFGLTGADQNQGDANGDGIVDSTDLDIWSSQFGSAPGALGDLSPVPEPTSLLLVVAGLLGGWGRGRRR